MAPEEQHYISYLCTSIKTGAAKSNELHLRTIQLRIQIAYFPKAYRCH